MRLSDFVYDLDSSCVAREPSEVRLGRRGLNRMLCVDRARKSLEDDHVASLPLRLNAGDVVVLNDSCRSPGVLFGSSEEGGQIELRLVRRASEYSFVARLFPTHFVTAGATLRIGQFSVRVLDGPRGPHGLYILTSEKPLDDILSAHGLPIPSFFYDGYFRLSNYNPTYAKKPGSFESPMAGLHLSDDILDALKKHDVAIAYLTHHVVGSWLPPETDDIGSLTVAEEQYDIPEATARLVQQAKSTRHRVLAVGSTCVRALETAYSSDGSLRPGPGASSLCIRPGFHFRCVDAYLTSFHPARSSLMVLDVAFSGLSLIRAAYKHACAERYLFLEFGDAVLYL